MNKVREVNSICEYLDAAYVAALGLANDELYDEKQEILEEIRNLQDMLERYKDSMFIVTPVTVEVTLNAVMRVRHSSSQSNTAPALGCEYMHQAIEAALDYADLDLHISDVSILEVRDQEADGDYDFDVKEA